MHGIVPSQNALAIEMELEKKLREKYAVQLADKRLQAEFEAKIEAELGEARFTASMVGGDDYLIR